MLGRFDGRIGVGGMDRRGRFLKSGSGGGDMLGDGWAETYADFLDEPGRGDEDAYPQELDALYDYCYGLFDGSLDDGRLGVYDSVDVFNTFYWGYGGNDDGRREEGVDGYRDLYLGYRHEDVRREAVAILISIWDGVNSPAEAYESLKSLLRDCVRRGYRP